MYLAIDIGGTKTELGFFGSKKIKSLKSTSSFKTKVNFKKEVGYLLKTVKKQKPDKEIEKIVVSFPGTISKNGNILKAGNLPNFVQKPLKDTLKREFNPDVNIIQDSACSAIAEVAYGYTKGYSRILHLILGTGFGGAIVETSKEKIRVRPFEPGGMIVDVKKGKSHLVKKTKGLVEAYIGGGSVKKYYKKDLSDLNDDDPIWKEVTKYLAVAINNLNCILKPDLVILGGGIAKNRKKAFKGLASEVEKISEFVKTPKIEFTKIKGNSSLLGAQAYNSSKSRIEVI